MQPRNQKVFSQDYWNRVIDAVIQNEANRIHIDDINRAKNNYQQYLNLR